MSSITAPIAVEKVQASEIRIGDVIAPTKTEAAGGHDRDARTVTKIEPSKSGQTLRLIGGEDATLITPRAGTGVWREVRETETSVDEAREIIYGDDPPAPDAEDPQPIDVPLSIEGAMIGAGIPRMGAATVRKALADVEIDGAAEINEHPEIGERLKARMEGTQKAGLAARAAALWILTGEDDGGGRGQLATQMRETSARSSTTRRASSAADPSDVDAARLGTEAAAAKGKPLSQKVTATEVAKARVVLRDIAAGGLGDVDYDAADVPRLLGFKSEKAMRAYVDGRETGDEKSKAGVKALTKGIASHQCWARKAAAAAFGIVLQARKP